MFQRYIGIDYSGAGLPASQQNGIRVFSAVSGDAPVQVYDPAGGLWSRVDLARWLIATLEQPAVTLVGIDHCFSFPDPFLRQHNLEHWDGVLDFADRTWATRTRTVAEVMNGWNEFRRWSGRQRLRRTEQFTSSAKSIFSPVGAGVAHSSFAGLPWLLDIRRALRHRVHFWPFDGWEVPSGRSCLAEVYPSLFTKRYDSQDHPGGAHSHDAYSVCRWMHDADCNHQLSTYFRPPLCARDAKLAKVEGWILGVM